LKFPSEGVSLPHRSQTNIIERHRKRSQPLRSGETSATILLWLQKFISCMLLSIF